MSAAVQTYPQAQASGHERPVAAWLEQPLELNSPEALNLAFRAFNQLSTELNDAYLLLQDRVAQLTREVEQAICSHFTSMAERTRRELRGEFRRGLKSLGFAALVVALLFLVQELLALSGDGRLHRMLAQSLIVISWVMLWIPLEALLFAPMNLRRRRKVLEKLGRARVSVVRREAGAGR